MHRLDGQVAVVTGASSGIGAAVACACSERGALVALAARSEERLARVAARCPAETAVVPCDVTSALERSALVKLVVGRWGKIDVLVNSAGIGYYASFEEIDLHDLRQLFEVDVVAVLAMTQEVLRVMRQAGRGLIVQIASTGGVIAHAPNVSAYLAAKHAVVGMSRGLRRELEGTGIRVQVVCPHLTNTGFFRAGLGADAMTQVADRLRDRMDSADQVADGIVAQFDSERFVIFPTDRSQAAYKRFLEAV
jgi:short-subunit dehydrogenase